MKVYAQPIAYWLLALTGLVLALLSDGAADAVALGLLTVPLVAIARHLFGSASHSRGR